MFSYITINDNNNNVYMIPVKFIYFDRLLTIFVEMPRSHPLLSVCLRKNKITDIKRQFAFKYNLNISNSLDTLPKFVM